MLALTCSEPPGEVTHWTGRALAQAVGISLRSVQRIWDAHRLQPHRVRSFKRSNDPAFAEKSRTSSGSIWIRRATPSCSRSTILRQAQDEESQIQALERTRPSRPVTPGRPETQTHDYIRHGTTTLFAALDVLEGTVIGRCMQRHRHEEFLRFLNTIEAAVPAGKLIHVILDNYGTHKHPKVRPGWFGTHAGSSTSPRPRPRG